MGLALTLISQRPQGNGVYEKKKLGGIDSGSIDSIGEGGDEGGVGEEGGEGIMSLMSSMRAYL
ncbi:hypothetical protein KI387_012805, partial [Taxus chinensis]